MELENSKYPAVIVTDIDIEESDNCEDDYLEVSFLFSWQNLISSVEKDVCKSWHLDW